MNYRPEIDGLRAMAIIPVVLFHAGFHTFSGGYTGVDVFFVISGFLITTIIYSELNQNNFSIVKFYERRSRRILPLLFFILLITLPLAWISLFQVDMIDYFESLTFTSLFSSNFLFAFEANYFDASVELKPLLHTWSLAVEEQYYIIFPLFMILMWKLKLKKHLLSFLFIFGCLSFILAEWASFNYPKYNFYLLPTRSWELAIGALLAIAIKKSLLDKVQQNTLASEALSLTGFALIMLGFFVIKVDTRFPSVYALFPTVGTVLIIGFANSKNLIGRLLSLRGFVFIGLISYSAYLWHHPIFAFYKHLSLTEETFIQKIILSASIIPLSYLTWKYVENPFRNKKKFSRKFIFTFSIIGSVFFIISGFVGIANKGFPNRAINSKLDYLNYKADNRMLKSRSWMNVEKANKEFENKAWYKESNKLPNLLLIGNSHSKDLYNAFLSSTDVRQNFEIAIINSEVSEFSNPKNEVYKSANYQEAMVVMITSHYYQKDLEHIEPLVDNLLNDNKTVVLVKEHYKYKMTNSRTLADVTIQGFLRNEKNKSADSLKISSLVNEVNKASFENRVIASDILKIQADEIIDQIKQKHPNLIVLDRNDYICNQRNKSCFVLDSKLNKYFYDQRHTSLEGAEFFGKKIDETHWLMPLIEFYKN